MPRAPRLLIEQQEDGTYAADYDHKVIATGSTQRLAIDRGRKIEPDAIALAERVRDTEGGKRDKWRRVY
jgi:hypothetical protein